MLNIKHKVAVTKKYLYDTFHILIGHQHKIKARERERCEFIAYGMRHKSCCHNCYILCRKKNNLMSQTCYNIICIPSYWNMFKLTTIQ